MMPTGGIRSRALWRGRIRVSTPCMPRFHVLSSQSRIPFQPSSTLLGRLPHSSHCCYPRPPTPTTGPKTQEIHSWLHSRLAPPTPSFKSPLSKVPRSKFFSFCEISARGTPDRALTTYHYRYRSDGLNIFAESVLPGQNAGEAADPAGASVNSPETTTDVRG